MLNAQAYALPSEVPLSAKLGFDFQNSQAKAKALLNLRNYLFEANFTYLARNNLTVGANLIVGSRFTNLEKYDFGFSWEAAPNYFVGLKHESLNKEKLQLGRFFLLFHHNATTA